MKREVGAGAIEIAKGDITREQVDAIVNAANKTLLGGGGVDGAIHRAAGRVLDEECRKLRGCDTGDAKITTGGNLRAKCVIHTVGPIYRDGKHGEPGLLASCHRRSLEVAVENGLKTVSFPAISCGVYGYPVPEAARIAMKTVGEFLQTHKDIELVRFVLFTQDVYDAFEQALTEFGSDGVRAGVQEA